VLQLKYIDPSPLDSLTNITQSAMTTSNFLLPKEAVALIQHIELNRAGWWDKSILRLSMATVWLSGEPPTADEINAGLESTFKLLLTTQKLKSVLDSLVSRKQLMQLPNHTYPIFEGLCTNRTEQGRRTL
jgi:hypothetical protein